MASSALQPLLKQTCVFQLERLLPLGRQVPAIVDDDNFTVLPDALDAFVHMAIEVAQAH